MLLRLMVFLYDFFGIVPALTRVKASMSALISLLLMGQAVVGQGGTSAGDLNGYYNPRREITLIGTVTGKTKGQAPGYAEGMSILVRSGKKVQEVEVGPSWFVGRQSSTINLGDKVKVTGVPLVVDRHEKVLVARQIVRGNRILALRDRQGMPFWVARREANYAMDEGSGSSQKMSSRTRYQGTLGEMKMYNVNGEQYAGYVVNTPNGPVDVAFAPSWYWNNQPSYFTTGDSVTLFGDGGGTRLGNGLGDGGVVLLNSASYGGGTLVFNQGGYPTYSGFRSIGNITPGRH